MVPYLYVTSGVVPEMQKRYLFLKLLNHFICVIDFGLLVFMIIYAHYTPCENGDKGCSNN